MITQSRPTIGVVFTVASFFFGAALNLGGYHAPILAAVLLLASLLGLLYLITLVDVVHRSLQQAKRIYPMMSLALATLVGAVMNRKRQRLLHRQTNYLPGQHLTTRRLLRLSSHPSRRR
jgi:hypothetical protein